MANQLNKIDPIRDTYYTSVEIAERCFQVLFYVTAILSFVVLFVDKLKYVKSYNAIVTLFVVAVIVGFIMNQIISLYFKPRAEDKRLQDFLSKAYKVSLNLEETQGYYNNEQIEPMRRIGAQVLENCYFSKSVIMEMLRVARFKNAIYIVTWLIAAIYRSNDLDLIAMSAQVLFSEQIVSWWIRLEWLRSRVEKIYDSMFRHFQNTRKKNFEVMVQENFVMYECAKARAGIVLSVKIFDQLNEKLTQDWIDIKKTIGIK